MVILIGAFCYLTGIAFWFFAIVAALLMLSTLIGTLGIAGLPLVAVGGLTIEYVLGFPELFLTHRIREETPKPEQVVHEMVGRKARTTGPLRPQGDIVIDGESFAASSASGRMIDSGVFVSVVGSRNGNLLVTEHEGDE